MANLNSRWCIACRQLNQAIRRMVIRGERRQRLWDEKRQIVSMSFDRRMTPGERERLGQINWTLGRGTIYRLTPEERAKITKIARKYARELKEELERRKHEQARRCRRDA